MSAHLNEVNIIFSHFIAQEVVFLDFVKVVFILPNSWETFKIAQSSFVALDVLMSLNGEGYLLVEEAKKSTKRAPIKGKENL